MLKEVIAHLRSLVFLMPQRHMRMPTRHSAPLLRGDVLGCRGQQLVCRAEHHVAAGAFIIRRLVGIAHTADMDSIEDAGTRAACELRALRFGRHLLVEGANTHTDIRALAAAMTAARQVDGLPADTTAGVNGAAASAQGAEL